MNDTLQKVDVERLYQHVLSIEGVKHPLIDPEKLNEAADYIKSEFQKYGLVTSEQTFEIEGYDMTFSNIEGHIGDDSKPEILVTSHYDTVRNAPGANDNGSGIAAMLETARVLADVKHSGSVRFISFTLEELNPTLVQKYRDKGIELGILDENYWYKSYHSQKMIKKFFSKTSLRIAKGQSILDSWEKSYEEIKDDLTESEKEYCEYIIELRSHTTRTSWVGQTGLIGSDYWVKKAMERNKQIKGVINLETIGYTSKRIGDFISVVSDKNSKQLGKAFCKNCKNEDIKLPYLWAKIPLRFEKIAKWMMDTLRSDNAPFWRENIPALMITDTANFRYPYYHTKADTIDKLDFDFIGKVTQATIATVLDPSEMNV